MSVVTESTATIVAVVIAAAVWILWAIFSDTRHNHGFWVALFLPLTPVIIPVLWLVFILTKYSSYLIFITFKRKEDHDEFMRKFKIRSGIFLLFK